MSENQDRTGALERLLHERIVILDGPRGTMIQALKLGERDFRGERFQDHPRDLKGDNDLLSLTRPDLIAEIHRQFLEAGSDLIGTNTFNANRISQADYGLEAFVAEMNRAAAQIARRAADEFAARHPARPVFVAGALGPTNKTASLAPDAQNPALRAVTFDQVAAAYQEQVRGLMDGGVDILLVETVFDTLNAKAALFAIQKCFDETGRRLPVMASVTFVQAGNNRTLTGQTVEAFWNSVSHAPLLSVGVNCSLGPKEMRPRVEELAQIAPIYVSCYPNAGLPNAFGDYDDTPDHMAGLLGEFARAGWLNLVGGCCGSTPAHIQAIAAAVRGVPPRVPPKRDARLRLSGLEPLTIPSGVGRQQSSAGVPPASTAEPSQAQPESAGETPALLSNASINFLTIGERTNIAGSPKFARCIKAGDFDAALAIARQQVENGAQLIDVCMDEGMIDGVAAMTRFLHLVASEPDISRVPVMVDSSKWEIIEAGLKCLQGKGIVNSISLKEGEEKFLYQARLIRRYGAAVVVMACLLYTSPSPRD